VATHPEILQEMEAGEFGILHNWLKDEIYQHGCKYTASELIERAIGAPLNIEPYIRYLKSKYGELYGL
jgi:carboxypeptidase Taq